MASEQIFRWLFSIIFLGAFSISVYYRRKARRQGETIPRVREGGLAVLGRVVFGIPVLLGAFTYVINPSWMAWAEVPIPVWERWLGVAAGLCTLPVFAWIFKSLGRNISETVFTKRDHQLVTNGPYRWIRHPLYSVGTLMYVAIGLIAQNWFIGLMGLSSSAMLMLAVIPWEEAKLIETFGDEYVVYKKRTGTLLPWIGRG